MNLRFKHVTAKNFLAFLSLDFDFIQFEGKTVLITGYNEDIQGDETRNGAGKSTLNNAVLFAIYGELLKPLKQATSIRNWSASVSPKDDVEVSLILENEKNEYLITRLLKGKKCSQELHVYSRPVNSTEETNWEEITLSTIAETQRLIETDIVPCGKEGFLRCVILTADQNYNFFKLNKAAKNSFFESLFELTKYSEMYTKLHRRTLDATTSLTASSKLIDNLNNNIAKLQSEKEEAMKNQNDIIIAQKELDKFKKELEECESDDEFIKLIASKTESYETFKKNQIASMSAKMKEFDTAHDITEIDSNHKIVFDKNSGEKIVNNLLAEYDRKNNIILNNEGHIEKTAEDKETIKELETTSATLNSRIKKGENAIKQLEEEYEGTRSKINSVNKEISSNESKITNMKNVIQSHSKISNILCEDCVEKYHKSVKIDNYPTLIKDYEDNVAKLTKDAKVLETMELETKNKIDKYTTLKDSLSSSVLEISNKLLFLSNSYAMKMKFRCDFKKSAYDNIKNEQIKLQTERDLLRKSLIADYKENCLVFESEINNIKNEHNIKINDIKRNIKSAEYKLSFVSAKSSENFDAPIRSLNNSLETEKTNFDSITEEVSHYKALEEVLKPDNIRKSVVPDMLKELNFRISGYMAKMGSNYSCVFDEDFDATFLSNTGKKAEYNNFSSGEQMRLSIACCLAFRDFMQVRLDFHPNMLVIDEFIDANLDAMAVSGIMDTVRYMVGTENISAFIISHRSEIKQGTFDSEIFIRKKDDSSKIIIDGIES